MSNRVARELDFGRKLLLVAVGVAAVAGPVVLGQADASVRASVRSMAELPRILMSPLRNAGSIPLPYTAVAKAEQTGAGRSPAGIAQLQSFPLRPQLDGRTVSIPGFIVPFEDGAQKASEFLLVPYSGSCIHVPPPPANQMVNVKMNRNASIRVNIEEPVVVTGQLKITALSSRVDDVSYGMTAMTVQPYNESPQTRLQNSVAPQTSIREVSFSEQVPQANSASPQVPLAANADPSFEEATIKPNESGAPGKAFRPNGRNFSTVNTSLGDLIQFAYDIHVKQVVDVPDWVTKDKYDIAAVEDGEGAKNLQQLKAMVKKLLADRFKLSFHHDKRELSVYVLSVGKGGPKNLAKSDATNSNFSVRRAGAPGGVSLTVKNATMADFTGFELQGAVLDRPAVDQTGLTGRYDFTLLFMPTEAQFGGLPQPVQPSDNPAPELFTAIQEQLGLKLDAVKTPVEVLVIDHAEEPSPN